MASGNLACLYIALSRAIMILYLLSCKMSVTAFGYQSFNGGVLIITCLPTVS